MTSWLFLSLWGAAFLASGCGPLRMWVDGAVLSVITLTLVLGAWAGYVAAIESVAWYRERRAFKRIGMVPPARVVRP